MMDRNKLIHLSPEVREIVTSDEIGDFYLAKEKIHIYKSTDKIFVTLCGTTVLFTWQNGITRKITKAISAIPANLLWHLEDDCEVLINKSFTEEMFKVLFQVMNIRKYKISLLITCSNQYSYLIKRYGIPPANWVSVNDPNIILDDISCNILILNECVETVNGTTDCIILYDYSEAEFDIPDTVFMTNIHFVGTVLFKTGDENIYVHHEILDLCKNQLPEYGCLEKFVLDKFGIIN
jgi:hypothetical protein